MSAPNTHRQVRLTMVDLRSQFVWLLLAILGLFVVIVGWLEWGM